ncbi:transcriptional repressor LexA [Virgibacillus halodenitrificans]|uniref:transcriptional repressor LexA n=1 Tax=Virgibacillus halodenitrificans TaxID=1482 RepID=UPI0013CE9AC4|nr:transcriptional repressor LexA [Virgibacillus halodenitrificans]
MSLTDRESEILDFVKKEVHLKGYPPSVREIGTEVGLSSSATVHGYLTRLEEKGYIRKDPVKSRSIEVIQTDKRDVVIRKGVPVPVIQNTQKGLSVFQHTKEYFTIPEQLITSKQDELFLVQVTGNEMKNFGILDGDYIVTREQQVALNGELVVVLQDGQKPKVRRFYIDKKGIELTTENIEEEHVNDVFIIGKVLGVQRKF